MRGNLRRLAVIASLAVSSFSIGTVLAQTNDAALFGPSVTYETITDDLDSPTSLVEAPDGSGRLFVTEKRGAIRIIQNGRLWRSWYLDLEDLVSGEGQVGLIGLAFPRNFSQSKLFYASYIDRQGDFVVARFKEEDEDDADEDSISVVLKIVLARPNRTGGQLQFGNDGYLYISTGDGGGDTSSAAQDLKSFLGKILRIDVTSQPSGYKVPNDNPFREDSSAEPEIWALGFQDPQHLSLDRLTGDLFLADSGSTVEEEVDVLKKGGNFGWNVFEGARCVKDPCASGSYVSPIDSYPRNDGASVVGGSVYRGTGVPSLEGRYVFGDAKSGALWSLSRLHDGSWRKDLVARTKEKLAAIGQDVAGELYLLTSDGKVIRLVAPKL